MTTDIENKDSEQMPAVPTRVDQIRADRACIGCGFNLFGQNVTKEEHYGLAIARCPECGEVAAIQNYPTMSHWVNRVRALLTAVWVVMLVGVFVGNGMTMVGFCAGAIQIASEDLGDEIGIAHQGWVDTQAQRALDLQKQEIIAKADGQEESLDTSTSASGLNAGGGNATSTATTTSNGITTRVVTAADGSTTTTINGVRAINYGGAYSYTTITPAWLDREYEGFVDSLDGLWGHIDRSFLILLIPGSVMAFVSGVFWSVTLLGARRRRVVWIPLVMAGLVLSFVITMNMTVGSNAWAGELAKTLIVPLVAPLVVGVQVVFAAIGIFFGRKFARFVVLLTLPPRSRVSLSILWTRDGLELPKPVMK